MKPYCIYEYQVSNIGEASNIYKFSGRTPKDGINDAYSLTVFGDLGIGHVGNETIQLLLQQSTDKNTLGIMHVGDIAYDLYGDNGKTGDDYLRMIQPLAANIPYMTLPGNHEMFQNFDHYKNRFYMPKSNMNKNSSLFYSIDLGPAHFIMLNTNAFVYPDFEKEAKIQMEWLIGDLELANQNRNQIP